MKAVQCSVTGCTNHGEVDIYPEGDSRAWLCTDHFAQTKWIEWTTFDIDGRLLMLDASGSWFYLPEADMELRDLARKAGYVK